MSRVLSSTIESTAMLLGSRPGHGIATRPRNLSTIGVDKPQNKIQPEIGLSNIKRQERSHHLTGVEYENRDLLACAVAGRSMGVI